MLVQEKNIVELIVYDDNPCYLNFETVCIHIYIYTHVNVDHDCIYDDLCHSNQQLALATILS